MLRHLSNWIIAAGFIFFGLHSVNAQIEFPSDTSVLVTVQTVDGNFFMGKIVSSDTAMIVLKTDNYETVAIRKSSVKNLRQGVQKQSRFSNIPLPESNTQAFRYFAGPSGYGLARGQICYDNSMLIFNQVSYGITDHFSLGAGFAPIPMFDFALPVWVAPKLSIPIVREKVNFGLGAVYGRTLFDSGGEKQTFGAVFAHGTFGSRERNFSAGAGIAYSDDTWSPKPVWSLSGCLRTTNWFYLISENYRYRNSNGSSTLLSLGGRFMFWQAALDAIFVAPIIPDQGRFFPLPWVGFHLLFGKPRS